MYKIYMQNDTTIQVLIFSVYCLAKPLWLHIWDVGAAVKNNNTKLDDDTFKNW